MTASGNSLVLRAPRTGDLTLKVPYTDLLYLDVLDAEGNYKTLDISGQISIKAPRPITFKEFAT